MIKNRKIIVASFILFSAVFFCGNASAWWGMHGRLFGGCCSPCFSTCDPCCDPCVTTCCDPCGSVGWGCCGPGPVRRLLGGCRWGCFWGWRSGCFDNACYDSCGCGCGFSTGCCGYGGNGYNNYYDSGCGCDGSGLGGDVLYDNGTMVSPSGSPTPAKGKSTVVEPSPVGESRNMNYRSPNIFNASYQKSPSTPKLQNTQRPENSGLVTIYVPLDAKVYVNGKETELTGSRRAFVSFGLEKGFEYDYVIKAVVVRKGQSYEETKTITLQAGDNRGVAFPFESLNTVPDEDTYSMY